MKQFLSVATIYDKNNQNIVSQSKKLVDQLSKIATNSELILLVKDYEFFSNLDLNLNITKENVQVKVVSTYKMSKDFIFENVAWQSAIGDVLIYHESIEIINSHIENIINNYEKSQNHIMWLTNKSDSRNKRQFTFERVKKAYSQHGSIISKDTSGYVIDRFAINAGFNNQKEQYDPILSLATSGLKSHNMELLNDSSNQTNYSVSHNDYQISDILDMLTYYTKFSVFKLLSCISFIILLMTSLLVTISISIPFLSFLFGALGLISSICILLYPFFIVARQTFAAANEKNVVGHFEIKKVL